MKRVLISLHGQDIGLVDDRRLLVRQGIIVGDWGDQVAHSDCKNVAVFDDFLGATISSQWGVHKGSDGAAANFAITAGLSGTISGTTGATSTTMAGSGIQLDNALNFQAQGNAGSAASNNLEFNIRLKLSAITGLCIFVGFTNQVGTLQMPIQGSGTANGLTANAANAVGFLYDTSMSTADWWGVGVDASTVATAQDSGSGPTAATYDQFQISIDQLGNANFFRNKNQVGVTMASAVNPTTPLTPVVAAFGRIAASKNVVIDRIAASMGRI